MSTGEIATADYLRFSLTYGSPLKVCAPKSLPAGWDRECRSLQQGGALLHAGNTLLAVALILFTGPLLAILAIAVRLMGRGPVLAQDRCRTRFRTATPGGALRRYCLHELPVLFDMLEGEYYFGPRKSAPPERGHPVAATGAPLRQRDQARPIAELV